jgi:hypothetical protein
MAHTVSEYKRAAADARKKAARTSAERQRQALLRVAAQWDRLAEEKAREADPENPKG